MPSPKFARIRKAPSRNGGLFRAYCPKCDSEYGGWWGMAQPQPDAQTQADKHNAENHEN